MKEYWMWAGAVALVTVLGTTGDSHAGNADGDTVILLNAPVYGGQVELHVHLGHRYQQAKFTVQCSQVQSGHGVFVYRSEQALLNSGWAQGTWDGDVSEGPLRSPSPLFSESSPDWDPAVVASCFALAFRETAKGPVALTRTVNFTVEGGGAPARLNDPAYPALTLRAELSSPANLTNGIALPQPRLSRQSAHRSPQSRSEWPGRGSS